MINIPHSFDSNLCTLQDTALETKRMAWLLDFKPRTRMSAYHNLALDLRGRPKAGKLTNIGDLGHNPICGLELERFQGLPNLHNSIRR